MLYEELRIISNFAPIMVYIDDSLYDFDLPLALQQISPQRREQALRFRHEQGQRECVLSYLLLKQALLQEYGIDENPLFEYGEHGKPSIVGHHDIHFSLSHCRQAVACVVSDHPVGIDIETVRAFREPLARYAMNDQELALIVSSSRPDVAFIRLWTQKEARLKMTGEGISNHLKDALAEGPWTITTVEELDRGYIYSLCESNNSHH